MKFLIDEDLSPKLVQLLQDFGCDAPSLRDRGRLGLKDWQVCDLAIAEDRTIVTGNGDDYRALMGRESVHPGLVILPSAAIEIAATCLHLVIDYLRDQDEPATDYLVNRVLSVDVDGTIDDHLFPPEG